MIDFIEMIENVLENFTHKSLSISSTLLKIFALFSADINDRVCKVLEKLKVEGALKGWESKVLGGGKMDHDASEKFIKVYGQSQVIVHFIHTCN